MTDTVFDFKPIPTITPRKKYWENGTWKFNAPEITPNSVYAPTWQDVILHGNTALTLVNSKADGLNYLKLFGGTEFVPETYIDSVTANGKCEQNGTPTPETPIDIVCNNGTIGIDSQGNIITTGTAETITDNVGNVATCERLLAILSDADTQEILSGTVTRKFSIKVLDGTENWVAHNTWYWADILPTLTTGVSQRLICTHFVNQGPTNDLSIHRDSIDSTYLQISYNAMTDANALKSWLATQYANGTPVIVVYGVTPITETVTGQLLTKSPVTYAGSVSGLTGTVVESSHTTPTSTNPLQINCNNGVLGIDGQGNITVTGTQEKVEINTTGDYAFAETLLKVGDYQDVQNVTDGEVTRNCEAVYYDGTQTINTPYISTTGGLDVGAIIVHPLSTSTTETVTAQPMNIQAGTNTVEITQAGMNNLELEVSYTAGGTIQ